MFHTSDERSEVDILWNADWEYFLTTSDYPSFTLLQQDATLELANSIRSSKVI